MITLWLATGVIAQPQDVAPPATEKTWPGTFIRKGKKYKSFEEIRSEIFGEDAVKPAPVQDEAPIAKPATPAEIARAALLEAQRINAERLAADTAQKALEKAKQEAELAAETARRARDDEEALIAILMAF